MENTREYYDLQALLKKEGYKEVADDDNYIGNVIDYLSTQDTDYTIFDWLKDTKENYPEDLLGYSKYAFMSLAYTEVSKMVEDINEFTDSIKAPRIPMRIGFSSKCYVIPISRDDIDRFKTAVEYVKTCVWQN